MLVVLLACWPAQAAATGTTWSRQYNHPTGDLACTVELSPLEATVADTIKLRLAVRAPESGEVAVRGPAVVADLDALAADQEPPRLADDHHLEYRYVFRYRAELPGAYRLEGCTVTWRDGEKAPLRLRVGPVEVAVASLAGPDAEPADIVGPLAVEHPRWWPWAGGGIVLLAAGGLVCWWRYGRSRREAAAPEPDPGTAACARLRELAGRRMTGPEDLRRAWGALDREIRTVVEQYCRIPARTLGAAAVATQLAAAKNNMAEAAALAEILATAETVTFGGRVGSEAEFQRAVAAALEAVATIASEQQPGRRP